MTPSPMVPCELCGEPGYYLAAPLPVSAYVALDPADDPSKWSPPEPRQACEPHFGIVRMRAEREADPERFAYEHQRPLPTNAQMRASFLSLADVLEEAGDPLRAARFRALANQYPEG